MNVTIAVVMGMSRGQGGTRLDEMGMSRSLSAMLHQTVQRRTQANRPCTGDAQCQKTCDELVNPLHGRALHRIGPA